MALHIRDQETDLLVRRLAKAKGVGLTEAVRHAVECELARTQAKSEPSLRQRLQPLLDEIDAIPSTGLPADKAFYDWLNDEDES
jgi:antitoxin VapB